MSENYAVPGGPPSDYVWRTVKAGYTPSRGDFVGLGTGGDIEKAVVVTADFQGDIIGICNKELRDNSGLDQIEIFHGPIVKAPIQGSSVVKVDESLYLGAVNTVYADTDAAVDSTPVGVAIRVEGTDYVVFRTHFYYANTPANATA